MNCRLFSGKPYEDVYNALNMVPETAWEPRRLLWPLVSMGATQ